MASLRMAAALPGYLIATVARGLLALATTMIAGLLRQTLIGLGRGELRTLSA